MPAMATAQARAIAAMAAVAAAAVIIITPKLLGGCKSRWARMGFSLEPGRASLVASRLVFGLLQRNLTVT